MKCDTQMLPEYRQHATGRARLPKLSVLAEMILGRSIQEGEHSSAEDARTTMGLYRLREAAAEAMQSCYIHVSSPDTMDYGLVGGYPDDDYNFDELVDIVDEIVGLPPVKDENIALKHREAASMWKIKSGTIKANLAFETLKKRASRETMTKPPSKVKSLTKLSPPTHTELDTSMRRSDSMCQQTVPCNRFIPPQTRARKAAWAPHKALSSATTSTSMLNIAPSAQDSGKAKQFARVRIACPLKPTVSDRPQRCGNTLPPRLPVLSTMPMSNLPDASTIQTKLGVSSPRSSPTSAVKWSRFVAKKK